MPSKKIRVFAGPNGSGKSSLFNDFPNTYTTGPFINADEIENKLITKGFIDLKELGVNATQADLDVFSQLPAALSLIKKAETGGHPIEIAVSENCIVDRSKDSHSYEASFTAAFIRHMLIAHSKTFCFETVMSHSSKIEEIRELKAKGYHPYLYFICIDDPEINVSRVANRVEKGGHPVSAEKIIQRYYRTLELLHEVLPLCYRAYLFDNSNNKKWEIVAELYNGTMELKTNKPPQWFINYVLPYYTT